MAADTVWVKVAWLRHRARMRDWYPPIVRGRKIFPRICDCSPEPFNQVNNAKR
jgi:hypothetical protein